MEFTLFLDYISQQLIIMFAPGLLTRRERRKMYFGIIIKIVNAILIVTILVLFISILVIRHKAAKCQTSDQKRDYELTGRKRNVPNKKDIK